MNRAGWSWSGSPLGGGGGLPSGDPEKLLPIPVAPGEIDVIQFHDAVEILPMNGVHPDDPWLALGRRPVSLADAHPRWWPAPAFSRWGCQTARMTENVRVSAGSCCQPLGSLTVDRGVDTSAQISSGWSVQGIIGHPQETVATSERADCGDAVIADALAHGVPAHAAKENKVKPDQHQSLARLLIRGWYGLIKKLAINIGLKFQNYFAIWCNMVDHVSWNFSYLRKATIL